MSELKVPFGLRNGRLYTPSEVAQGLACECVCPECKARLVANHPVSSKVDYFSHHAAQNCVGGYETALHLAAKQALIENRKLLVPGIRASVTVRDKETRLESTISRAIPSAMVFLDSVEKEVREFAGIVPDIVGTVGGKLLLVEVAVHHFVGDEKLKRLQTLGYPTLEIDLSGIDTMPSLLDVEKLVIHTPENRTWLVNPKQKALEVKIDAEARSALDDKIKSIQKALAVQAEAHAKYLLLPDEEKVVVELQIVGADEVAVTPFLDIPVRAARSFSVAPKVWQAATYAMFIHEKQRSDFLLSVVHRYLITHFQISERSKDASMVAIHDYAQFLCDKGLLSKVFDDEYEVVADANGRQSRY